MNVYILRFDDGGDVIGIFATEELAAIEQSRFEGETVIREYPVREQPLARKPLYQRHAVWNGQKYAAGHISESQRIEEGVAGLDENFGNALVGNYCRSHVYSVAGYDKAAVDAAYDLGMAIVRPIWQRGKPMQDTDWLVQNQEMPNGS